MTAYIADFLVEMPLASRRKGDSDEWRMGVGKSRPALPPGWDMSTRWSATNQELRVNISTTRHLSTSSQGLVHRSEVEKSCLSLRQRLCLKHALKQLRLGGKITVLVSQLVRWGTELAVWQVSNSLRGTSA